MENSYGSVSLKRIKDALNQIEVHRKGRTDDEIEITFEYLIGSFFPTIMTNIKDEVRNQYTKGFMEGYEAGQKEKNGSN